MTPAAYLGVCPGEGLVDSIVQDVRHVVAIFIRQVIHPHNTVGRKALQQHSAAQRSKAQHTAAHHRVGTNTPSPAQEVSSLPE